MSPITSLEKSKIKILLLEGVHQSAVDTLNAQGYSNIEYLKGALPEEELIEKIKGRSLHRYSFPQSADRKSIRRSRKTGCCGLFLHWHQPGEPGPQPQSAGVAVFNAPYSNTRSVAELVLAEAILLLRGVAEKNAKAHRGEWQKSAVKSYEIRGKKLGIVGYGSIGSQLECSG